MRALPTWAVSRPTGSEKFIRNCHDTSSFKVSLEAALTFQVRLQTALPSRAAVTASCGLKLEVSNGCIQQTFQSDFF